MGESLRCPKSLKVQPTTPLSMRAHPAIHVADRHELYTVAFQSPSSDIRFITDLFWHSNHRDPITLREDFCGTAAVSCAWVRSSPARVAFGVEIDDEPIDWCRMNRHPELSSDQASRLNLIHANAIDGQTPEVDVVVALNGSFCTFKQRTMLLRYLHKCRATLHSDGIFVAEVWAGPEAQMTGTDRIDCSGFEATWDQAEFNGATNEAKYRIHFRFPDGSQIENAFTYDWRLWAPAELVDALLESDFRDARIYWKGKDGVAHDANGALQPCMRVAVEDAWLAYIVGYA